MEVAHKGRRQIFEVVACHYVLIKPEERYLAGKFGEAYRPYAPSVHRRVGRARR